VLKQRERQYFFIADNYLYGGCVTFTAHLMHLLERKWFRRITNRFEKEFREFGYGICYQNVTSRVLIITVDVGLFVIVIFPYF
jgi:hypothetical protein